MPSRHLTCKSLLSNTRVRCGHQSEVNVSLILHVYTLLLMADILRHKYGRKSVDKQMPMNSGLLLRRGWTSPIAVSQFFSLQPLLKFPWVWNFRPYGSLKAEPLPGIHLENSLLRYQRYFCSQCWWEWCDFCFDASPCSQFTVKCLQEGSVCINRAHPLPHSITKCFDHN